MRQLTLVMGLIIGGLGSLSAAVVQCADVPGAVVTSANDILFSYSVFSQAGFTCEQQDKIYSNFNVGTLPTDTTLRLILQLLPGDVDIHTVVYGGSFTSNFTTGYTIAVDTAISTERIFQISGDIQNPGIIGTPSNLEMVVNGAFTGNITSTETSQGGPLSVPYLAFLNVTNNYTAGGSASTNVGNSFFQATPSVPEPATTALLGGGLLVLGLVRRRRKA